MGKNLALIILKTLRQYSYIKPSQKATFTELSQLSCLERLNCYRHTIRFRAMTSIQLKVKIAAGTQP